MAPTTRSTRQARGHASECATALDPRCALRCHCLHRPIVPPAHLPRRQADGSGKRAVVHRSLLRTCGCPPIPPPRYSCCPYRHRCTYKNPYFSSCAPVDGAERLDDQPSSRTHATSHTHTPVLSKNYHPTRQAIRPHAGLTVKLNRLPPGQAVTNCNFTPTGVVYFECQGWSIFSARPLARTQA